MILPGMLMAQSLFPVLKFHKLRISCKETSRLVVFQESVNFD